jgi:hypothetical protein
MIKITVDPRVTESLGHWVTQGRVAVAKSLSGLAARIAPANRETEYRGTVLDTLDGGELTYEDVERTKAAVAERFGIQLELADDYAGGES